MADFVAKQAANEDEVVGLIEGTGKSEGPSKGKIEGKNLQETKHKASREELSLPLGATGQCSRNRARGIRDDPSCISSPVNHDQNTRLLSPTGLFYLINFFS